MIFNKVLKYIIAPLLVISLISSCTDDFQEFNSDPSLLTKDQLDVGLLLTRVQKQVIINGNSPIGIFSNYSGYSSSGGNRPFDGGFYPDEFTKGYNNLLNISEIIRLTEGDPNKVNQHSISRIMRVYIFQYLTDLYGDIPYSEAVREYSKVITQPQYDTQESIYRDMLNELEEASDMLDENVTLSFEGADLIYNGDIDKWKRLANSLRLRLALRVRYADSGLAMKHISEVISLDLVDSNDGNAYVKTSEDFEDNRNPIYNRLVSRDGIPEFMGKTIIDLLKTDNDPRLTIFATPTPNSAIAAETYNNESLLEYRGRPLGMEGAERELYPDDSLSKIGQYFRDPILEMPVLYHSEVCFGLAEAKVVFDLGATTANEWYQRGIRSNMEQYNISDSEIDAYLNTNSGTLAGTVEEQLEQISNQKNLALFPNALEAWSEWRRTGFPRVLIGSEVGETGATIPRRINYPVAEGTINSENYQEASNRIGGDKLTTKNWWDANPNVPYQHPGVIDGN